MAGITGLVGGGGGGGAWAELDAEDASALLELRPGLLLAAARDPELADEEEGVELRCRAAEARAFEAEAPMPSSTCRSGAYATKAAGVALVLSACLFASALLPRPPPRPSGSPAGAEETRGAGHREIHFLVNDGLLGGASGQRHEGQDRASSALEQGLFSEREDMLYKPAEQRRHGASEAVPERSRARVAAEATDPAASEGSTNSTAAAQSKRRESSSLLAAAVEESTNLTSAAQSTMREGSSVTAAAEEESTDSTVASPSAMREGSSRTAASSTEAEESTNLTSEAPSTMREGSSLAVAAEEEQQPSNATVTRAAPLRSEPFDCNRGYETWFSNWSDSKQAWCCKHYPPVGCTDDNSWKLPTTLQTTSTTTNLYGRTGPIIENGYILVGDTWVILPKTSTTTSTSTPPCETAKEGDECYDHTIWTMYTGLNLYPEQYPGLGLNSTFEQVQTRLHERNEGGCRRPCSTETHLPPRRPWGTPSLFCFSVFRPGSELDLMKAQVDRGAGIFACDEQRVFSEYNYSLGGVPEVRAILIPDVATGVSQDGTAANTMTFMTVWSIIKADKTYRHHDFTVKADPDAVILPDRLRTHLSPHVDENVFVRNCNKVPGSPNFPMMFGAVEVLSHAAVVAYMANEAKCRALPWKSWGEDYFLSKCLQMIGVSALDDFDIIKDGTCSGLWCGDGWAAAFHPLKTVTAWTKCQADALSAKPL